MIDLRALLLYFLASKWTSIFFFDMGFWYDMSPHHNAQIHNSIMSWSEIFISCQSKLTLSFAQGLFKILFIVKEYKCHLCLIPVIFIWFYKEMIIFANSSKWSLLFLIQLGILSLILFLFLLLWFSDTGFLCTIVLAFQ